MVRLREQQSLTENAVWRALAGVAVVVPLAVAVGLALAGRAPASANLALAIVPPLLAAGAIVALSSFCRLIVEVRDDGVYVRFTPFQRRFRGFPAEEIVGAAARTYRPLRDYGGWGIRLAPGGRRAYTVAGNRGCELVLADGRRIMLGSRDPERLEGAIRAMLAASRARRRPQSTR